MPNLDIEKIIKRAKKESQRGRVVLYLDKPLFKEFQQVCERRFGVSASLLVEEFIREVNEYSEHDQSNYLTAADSGSAPRKT